MDGLYKGYILTKDKKAIEKFKGKTSKELKQLEDVENEPEYAGVLADDTILIDIDDEKQSEKMFAIVQDMEMCCKVTKTTRGMHFLFKNHQLKTNKTHTNLAIGLTADIKLGSKCSYERIKDGGKLHRVLWDIEPENGEVYQEVPKMFLPVKSDIQFSTLESGDGRNSALFGYILTLQRFKYTTDEIKDILRNINRYVLDEPMEDSELEVIIRDSAFQKPVFYEDKKFLHDVFAEYLRDTRKIIKINNQLHIYDDGVYRCGYQAIEKAMIEEIPTLVSARRKGVLQYLYLICEEKEIAPSRYIAFTNGILDIVTGEMQPHSADIVVTNMIPYDYKEDAYCQITDITLDKLSCNDKEIRAILEEAVGYCFFRENTIAGGKALILTGDKSNGKSTYLSMIIHALGTDNIAAMDLSELSDRFNTAMLFGKMANVGDDLNDSFMSGNQISIFKKIVTGNRIKAERKGQDPFEFSPYCKLLFSANEIPRMQDKTGAIMRRLEIIPFNATFSKDDKDYDPFIGQKLEERDSMEYFIKLGVDGLKRLLTANEFTECEAVENELKDYERIANPLMDFLDDCSVDEIKNHTSTDVYKRYQLFCRDNGLKELSQRSLTQLIKKHLGLIQQRTGFSGRVFVDPNDYVLEKADEAE